MAREGYLILDSDLHLMEPYDLWERTIGRDNGHEYLLPAPRLSGRCWLG